MKYVINENVIVTKDEGELVLLDMNTGFFYGLDLIGTEVWTRLSSGNDIVEIINGIHKLCGVDIQIINNDIRLFLNNMIKYGLVNEHE